MQSNDEDSTTSKPGRKRLPNSSGDAWAVKVPRWILELDSVEVSAAQKVYLIYLADLERYKAKRDHNLPDSKVAAKIGLSASAIVKARRKLKGTYIESKQVLPSATRGASGRRCHDVLIKPEGAEDRGHITIKAPPGDESARSGWTVVGATNGDSPTTTANARLVLICLIGFRDYLVEKGRKDDWKVLKAGVPYLSKQTGLKRAAIRAAIDELHRWGAITKHLRTNATSLIVVHESVPGCLRPGERVDYCERVLGSEGAEAIRRAEAMGSGVEACTPVDGKCSSCGSDRPDSIHFITSQSMPRDEWDLVLRGLRESSPAMKVAIHGRAGAEMAAKDDYLRGLQWCREELANPWIDADVREEAKASVQGRAAANRKVSFTGSEAPKHKGVSQNRGGADRTDTGSKTPIPIPDESAPTRYESNPNLSTDQTATSVRTGHELDSLLDLKKDGPRPRNAGGKVARPRQEQLPVYHSIGQENWFKHYGTISSLSASEWPLLESWCECHLPRSGSAHAPPEERKRLRGEPFAELLQGIVGRRQSQQAG